MTQKKTQAKAGLMETKLKKVGADIDKLVARVEKTGFGLKSDYLKRIDGLKNKRSLAEAKLSEVKKTSQQKLTTLKTGLGSALGDLERTFKDLKQPKRSASKASS